MSRADDEEERGIGEKRKEDGEGRKEGKDAAAVWPRGHERVIIIAGGKRLSSLFRSRSLRPSFLLALEDSRWGRHERKRETANGTHRSVTMAFHAGSTNQATD